MNLFLLIDLVWIGLCPHHNIHFLKIFSYDNYKQLFEDYYGEPYTKTEEENAYLWISENCSVILDSTDGEISIFYYPPAKTDIDKELVESKFRAHTTKVDFKIGEIKEKLGSSGSK